VDVDVDVIMIITMKVDVVEDMIMMKVMSVDVDIITNN